ncbi:hypothetical protein KP509_31G030400 [Ceratopteris richardii]|nr:hypothetical protein KP509_31G030400 [Ceratopteris richardii]
MRMPSSHYRFKFLVEQFSEATKAIAVLVNSISELERNVLQNLEYKVPVFCIGPSLMLGDARTLSSMNGLTTSILPVQEDCLSWLDKQITGSVLYVSFGSITTFTKLQLMELALGLEASEQVFLWVIRPGSFEGLLSDVLPPGFVERTKNKCYIVSWCPQVQVLSHKAVGGFLTHCGWNSILENISLGGLPMICWPDGGEQALNAKVVVDVWKVGLSVAKQDDITVGREEIEHLVRALMQGEGAQQFKCKAAKLRGIVHQAVQETGSSVGNIKKVLEIVRNVRSKSC